MCVYRVSHVFVVYAHSIDIIYTVAFPVFVLVYSYATFTMDRKELELRNKYITKGAFDDTARYFADPAAISMFKSGFDSLRVFTWWPLVLRFTQNLLFCGRVLFLIRNSKRAMETREKLEKAIHHKQKPLPKWVGGVVLVYGALLTVFAAVTVHQSTVACAPYTSGCTTFAYRLVGASNASCPCIHFIERQMRLTSYDEWLAPSDMTDALRSVASPAKLMTVSIINHKLTELPDTLEKCTNLREL